MTTVHYVWWGLPTQTHHIKAANDTPNKIAQACGTVHDIHYWRMNGTFRPTLNARLNTHVVTDPAEIIRNTPAWHGQGIAIRNIVNTLTRYNAYAAAKDLVSLLVLYRHGGYYFDTTTLVRPLDRNLNSLPTNYVGPKIIFRGANRTHSFTKIDDRSPMATYNFGRVGNKTLPAVDVWAMYAPPQHKAISLALESYIDRGRNFGLDRYPATKRALAPAVPVSINDVMNSQNKTIRNRILGTLIIASVQEGLQKETSHHATSWSIQDVTGTPPTGCEGAVTYCTDLRLYKRHAGFWRNG